MPKSKWVIVMHLNLAVNSRARLATSELTVWEMSSSNGIELLVNKLDCIFLQDNNWCCFNTYLSFVNLKHKSNGSIDEYFCVFDNKLNKIREMKIELPNAILVCRLLKSYNLNEIHFQLALSITQEMTFNNMRHIKKIFAESGGVLTSSGSESVMNPIEEPVFEGKVF